MNAAERALLDALRDALLSLVEENAHQLVGGGERWGARLRKIDKLNRAMKLAAPSRPEGQP